ncbi:MAG: acyl-CoA dehydrogenase family protein [Dehalococcoidales bacterium]|nr:acyl-CoA dehydrogenase family protein [Dehalococcoidales bacterium]
MNFKLSEEQLALQKLAGDFSRQEIEPISDKLDREGRLPDDLIKKCAQIGLLGMTVPKKYGGTEVGNLSCVLAIEQLAYSGSGAWWLVGFNNSIPESIANFGSEMIKKKYLKSFCDGSAYASIQFTEDETGSDPAALTTTALPGGDDYVINGMKRFSTFGAREGYAVTYTKDENGNCTAFVIEKGREGYSAPKIWELMGGGGMEAADVYFDNFRVPKENLLGIKGEGMKILLSWIAAEKIQQCAAAVGIAQAALDEAIKYTRNRMSRGRPVSGMQGIRWMLADMQAKIEACRWLTYKTAFAQEEKASSWQTESATAKIFVVPAAMEVVEMSRRLHGAYGYAREFKIERLYRAIAGCASIAVSLEINHSIVGGWLVENR